MMVSCELKSSTVNGVVTNLTQKQNNVLEAGHRGLSEAAEELFAQAQSIVPRKTGALAASGKVTYKDNTKSETAIISYGDATVNPITKKATSSYAVSRHESPGPGGKWLENTIMGGYDLFMGKLITHISEEL
jgi:hypothetical protein